MTDFLRTPDAVFAKLDDFPYAPNYHTWNDLRVHYVDEGPRDGPVALLLHGMPTWSYLYRSMIPPLVAAGYRCIAPDHLGFGRSDKPTDANWYSIARHTEVLTSLIHALDLNDVTLVCQDWGGPIGLAQAAMMPERFSRLVIMNTWLHHDTFEYSKGIRKWNQHWKKEGLFHRKSPNVAALLVFAAGHTTQREMIDAIVENARPSADTEGARVHRGYAAPFEGLDDQALNGARCFPLSIPFDNMDGGNGVAQQLHYRTLLRWDKPAHFIWGCADDIFTEAWGREWASRMPDATFDAIDNAGHFLQETHGEHIADLLLRRRLAS